MCLCLEELSRSVFCCPQNAKDVEVPPPGDDTVGLLLLLGAHAHADLTLLSQLARILTHALLRSGFLLSSPPTIAEGRRRIALVRFKISSSHYLTVSPKLCCAAMRLGLSTRPCHQGYILLLQ